MKNKYSSENDLELDFQDCFKYLHDEDEPSEIISEECKHEYKLINEEGSSVCTSCGLVCDDLAFPDELLFKEMDHYFMKKYQPYRQSRNFYKKLRFFKGSQRVKLTDKVIEALELIDEERDPNKVKALLKKNKLSKFYKHINWMLEIKAPINGDLEYFTTLVYLEILRVYPTYRTNKKKMFPFTFTLKMCMYIIYFYAPEYREAIVRICDLLPTYKIKSNFQKNFLVLKQCVENLNLSFLDKEMRHLLATVQEVKQVSNVNTVQMAPGHAMYEQARVHGIYKGEGYSLSESARQASLLFGNELPLRLKDANNEQRLIEQQGLHMIDSRQPMVAPMDQPPDMDISNHPRADIQMKAFVPPEQLVPVNSASNILLARHKMQELKRQMELNSKKFENAQKILNTK